MRKGDRTWEILAAATIGGAIAFPAIRLLFALPLALFLPGWAIVRLTMKPERFELEHILLASGLSMAITVFAGLLLHGLGAMTPLGWAAALGFVTAAALAAGGWPEWPDGLREHSAMRALGELSRRQIVLLAGAAAIGGAAFFVARERALQHREFPATQFWLTPGRTGSPTALTVGVKNLEGAPAEYDVEIMLDGRLTGAWRSIPLEDGQTWTAEANLEIDTRTGGRAEAWLFKNHARQVVYRRVWVDIGRG